MYTFLAERSKKRSYTIAQPGISCDPRKVRALAVNAQAAGIHGYVTPLPNYPSLMQKQHFFHDQSVYPSCHVQWCKLYLQTQDIMITSYRKNAELATVLPNAICKSLRQACMQKPSTV